MSEPVWNKFLTDRDKQVFSAAGYGARAGFGKRPALLVIDVSYAFTGDTPGEPILESIKRWRNSCGLEAWDGIAAIKRLLTAGRAKGLPVIYTTGIRRADNWDAGGWAWKNKRTIERQKASATNESGDTIVPEIATPSSPKNENSPLRTDGGGVNVTGNDPSHERLTSPLSRMVNCMGISYSGPTWATQLPLKSNDSTGA